MAFGGCWPPAGHSGESGQEVPEVSGIHLDTPLWPQEEKTPPSGERALGSHGNPTAWFLVRAFWKIKIL